MSVILIPILSSIFFLIFICTFINYRYHHLTYGNGGIDSIGGGLRGNGGNDGGFITDSNVGNGGGYFVTGGDGIEAGGGGGDLVVAFEVEVVEVKSQLYG
mmetsp:Transcript_17484/g.25918  ORF Transcript_17484/g.25918 Transcript_17484/m.25918 type:complete len:100 (-) Transcript_17484:52-351(-)